MQLTVISGTDNIWSRKAGLQPDAEPATMAFLMTTWKNDRYFQDILGKCGPFVCQHIPWANLSQQSQLVHQSLWNLSRREEWKHGEKPSVTFLALLSAEKYTPLLTHRRVTLLSPHLNTAKLLFFHILIGLTHCSLAPIEQLVVQQDELCKYQSWSSLRHRNVGLPFTR